MTAVVDAAPDIRRNFWLLWIAMFSTMAGGNMLLVCLSLKIYAATGSALDAGLVFVAQFTAAIFLSGFIERLCRGHPPRRVLLIADGMALLVVIAIGFVPEDNIVLVFVLLLARGFTEALMKSARGVAIKINFPAAVVERSNALLAAPHYLGNAAGVVLASLIVERLSIGGIGLVAAGLLALSICCYLGLTLRDDTAAAKDRDFRLLARAATVLRTNAALRYALGYVFACTALFQGYHQIARTLVPMDRLGLTASQSSVFQLSAVAGILVGTVVVATFLTGERRRLVPLPAGMTATALFCVMPWMTSSPIVALTGYFLFLAFFEITFLRAQNAMLLAADDTQIATAMVMFYALSYAGMAAVILVTGFLSDLFGGVPVALGVAAAAILVSLVLETRLRPPVGA
ncbi:MAG: MFS transporter [Rhizobiaceae bacterium]|nr:MFS transporter [Rhizobiaceae bacterium]